MVNVGCPRVGRDTPHSQASFFPKIECGDGWTKNPQQNIFSPDCKKQAKKQPWTNASVEKLAATEQAALLRTSVSLGCQPGC